MINHFNVSDFRRVLIWLINDTGNNSYKAIRLRLQIRWKATTRKIKSQSANTRRDKVIINSPVIISAAVDAPPPYV